MRKKLVDPFKNLKLDREEQEIYDSLERGEWKDVANVEEEKKRYISIFRQATKKDRRVSLRVNNQDLYKIQNRARESGLPYQTLINAILHQYAKGRIKVEL